MRCGWVTPPTRAARAFEFLTNGYRQSLDDVVNGAIFESDASEIILVKDIELYSMCEHHLLPFFGKAHVAYIPNGKIVGLSKIPRIVDVYARRLQVQERLTTEIAEAIERALSPRGVFVVIEAEHLCMTMRGVRKAGARTITSAVRGMMHNGPTRAEAMALIHNRR